MAKMIFISPYLKGRGEKAALARRTKYIATREGVELLKDKTGGGLATEKQREYIQRLLRSFPQAKELGEYEDYASEPTKMAASELIDQVWEQFITAMDQRENFLDYVAHRPGVQSQGDHGLWNSGGKVPNLSEAVREVAEHEGNVWTPIVSLRREDAERLGYTDAENWRALVCSCLPELAKGYKIQPENLRWYAALHEKEKHFHIHMIVFSSDPAEGYLTVNGIREIKSAFARQIFAQDLVQVYEQKTRYRNEVQSSAAEEMTRLISAMETGLLYSESLYQLTEELAQRLKTTKGKKAYGYLPPQVKRIVDAIVDELAKDERVAAAYSLWLDMRDEVCRTYSENPPERLPLSQQKEFKPVRNMVIREVLRLSERSLGLEDEEMKDEPEPEEDDAEVFIPAEQARPQQAWQKVYEQADRYRRAKAVLYSEAADDEDRRSALSTLEELWEEGYAIAAHQLGKAYRDGLGTERDPVKAADWFRLCAEKGYDCSAYALGKLLLEQGDATGGIVWLKKAAERGNQYARYRLGKVYLLGEQAAKDVAAALEYLRSSAEQGNQYAQYTLGKLYLLGKEVPRDRERAVDYLTCSAAQGNAYAQFFLDHLEDMRSPSAATAVIRMLHHMSRIFRERTTADNIHRGLRIDRKRWKELQEKRIALGHKPDDHEDQVQTMG